MMRGKAFIVLLLFALMLSVFSGIEGGERNIVSGEESTYDTVIWIHNVYELQNISKNLAGHYALANDINASVTKTWNGGSGFLPAGNFHTPFSGVFDGRGHKIINLYINRPQEDYVGLFAYTSRNAVIENVGFVNVSVIGGWWYVGGLVGWNEGAVSNSYATGNVRGGRDVGGLVGYNNGGTVNNSYTTCNVRGGDCVGGLVGANEGVVSNCYATGDVSGSENVGGLIGFNCGDTVSNSYATGNVNGREGCVGGLIGGNDGPVSKCYATGDVSGRGDVGGLVGWSGGTVENSYATGNVSGNGLVGGLVGLNCYQESYYPGMVRYTYATGRVRGSYDVGGLIGYNIDGTIIASFWDINTTGQTTSAGGTGKTTDEMKNKTIFTSAGWDFTNIWDIWDGRTYPFFKWQVVKAVPSEPLNLSVRSGNRYVNLSWEVPVDDGGSPIMGYRIYRGTRSGNETYLITVGNVLTYNDTGLTNGQRYYYRVSAVNGVGEGELSVEVNATPRTVPSAPRNLVARAGDGYVNLSWEVPVDDGGSPITGYWIYRGTSPGNETFLTTVGNVLTYNDTGLTNGQRYYYRVSALNGVGEGELSVEVSAVPLSVPSAPQNLVARWGDGYVDLTWEAPAEDGGSPIIGYKIYRGTSPGNETFLTTVGNVLTYNDTGLTNGQRYYYRVSAVSGVGEGELSVEVNATPQTVPSAPRNLVARWGDGYVDLTWEAPADDGGLPITGYRIYRGARSGDEVLLATVGNETTYYNDTEVRNGQAYYYRVSAVNGVGEGELSAEVNATPQSASPTLGGTFALGGMGSLLLLGAIMVVIVAIVLIVLFARRRKGESGESQVTTGEE